MHGYAPSTSPDRSTSSEHRGGGLEVSNVITDLAPAEAKSKDNEGDGRELETDGLGSESLRPIQRCQNFAEARVLGPKATPSGVKHLSCEPSTALELPMDRRRHALRWISWEAPVVQAFPGSLRARPASPCGNRKRSHRIEAHRVLGGLGLCWPF